MKRLGHNRWGSIGCLIAAIVAAICIATTLSVVIDLFDGVQGPGTIAEDSRGDDEGGDEDSPTSFA